MRTCEALDAIRSVAEQVPDMAVGAGTIASTGGRQALRALAGPLPETIFCPTGGIDRATSADYLALPNVACVGRSWLTPTNLVAAQDWDAITAPAAHFIA